jgi:hypothetical protein
MNGTVFGGAAINSQQKCNKIVANLEVIYIYFFYSRNVVLYIHFNSVLTGFNNKSKVMLLQ